MSTDPICGMSVDPENSPHLQVDGEVISFCSATCRDEYATAGRHAAETTNSGDRPDGR
jgi:YHS domain-containing protein